MYDAYVRVIDYCVRKDLSIHEFERMCRIPIGTIDSWQYEKSTLKHMIKVCMMMQVSPFWLESGKVMEEYNYKELCIVYILRNTDIDGHDKIIKTVIHEAFKES